MSKAPPTDDAWRRAYEPAAEILDLAPWTWMWDTDHRGAEDPESGSPRFISVVGQVQTRP